MQETFSISSNIGKLELAKNKPERDVEMTF